jgi:hypothetical protein
MNSRLHVMIVDGSYRDWEFILPVRLGLRVDHRDNVSIERWRGGYFTEDGRWGDGQQG